MNSINSIDCTAAGLCLAISELEDIFIRSPNKPSSTSVVPTWESNWCNIQWKILHWINGKDSVLNSRKLGLGANVMYGVVAKSLIHTNEYYLMIRGTETILEWVEDVEFNMIDSGEGMVEEGFYRVYQSLTVEGIELKQWVVNNLPKDAVLTVCGHSLGSAVACYAAAFIGNSWDGENKVRLCTFACPKPGSLDFAKFLSTNTASDSVVYNYVRDMVPTMPPLSIYCTPLCEKQLQVDFNIPIPNNPISNHLLPAYAALLDPVYIISLQSEDYVGILEGNLSIKAIGEVIKTSWAWITSRLF